MDFPISWLSLMNDEKLDEVLTQKGVTSGKTVILYGIEQLDGESQKLLAVFGRKGVKRIVLFNVSLSLWTADETIPMYSYPKYYLYDILNG